MKILITFPGKLGDYLWALNPVRELARIRPDWEIHMMVSEYLGECGVKEIKPDYIKSIIVNTEWNIWFDAPVRPASPPATSQMLAHLEREKYEIVLNLGLDTWPHKPTLVETFQDLLKHALINSKLDDTAVLMDSMPDPSPWLGKQHAVIPNQIMCAWTDEWVELKAGLTLAITKAQEDAEIFLCTKYGSRMSKEFIWPRHFNVATCDLVDTRFNMYTTNLLVTDKSAIRVLARGIGMPVVVVEPSVPRHNYVFDCPEHWTHVGNGLPEKVLNGFDAREMNQLIRLMRNKYA